MSATAAVENNLTTQSLAALYQYTIEAYKTFEKLAENLPNPMAAAMFRQFAAEERGNRDIIEMKIAAVGEHGVKATVGGDTQFSDIHEGDLSFREAAEFLIAREKTMQKRLDDLARNAGDIDRYFLTYMASVKRSHIVELEREVTLIRFDPDWWKREDAESRIVNGPPR